MTLGILCLPPYFAYRENPSEMLSTFVQEHCLYIGITPVDFLCSL